MITSLMARVRNRFAVAVAEVADNDLWQVAQIGMACVSNDDQHSNELLEGVQRYIEETCPDLLITHVETELMHW